LELFLIISSLQVAIYMRFFFSSLLGVFLFLCFLFHEFQDKMICQYLCHDQLKDVFHVSKRIREAVSSPLSLSLSLVCDFALIMDGSVYATVGRFCVQSKTTLIIKLRAGPIV